MEKQLLSGDRRLSVQQEWNRTGVVYPDKCIHQLFEEQVERAPGSTAIKCGDRKLTYGELNAASNRLANYIRSLGIGPEVRVGICLERSIEMVIAMLATLKAGGAYVPLDPKYPGERLQYMLADSRAQLLLMKSPVPGVFEGLRTACVVLDAAQQEIAACASSSPAVSMSTQNAAYVIYTSGSTGRPKGVVIRHSSAATLIYWSRDTYSNRELSGVLASTSICFDISIFEIFVPLCWGGAVIIVDNPIELPRLPEAAKVTLINTSPSIMSQLIKGGQLPSGLQTVNLAGEPLKRRLVQQIYGATNAKRVVNLYGPTEDTTYSTCVSLEKDDSREVPIGRPIANTQAYVLDAELEPVEAGEVGNLYIGGDGLARGYLDRPELTAQSFIPNSFTETPGERLYRTGDLARWNRDGNLEFLGRADHQVKIRGVRIELGEIESVLLEQSQVREVTVVVHGEDTGNQQLAAYYVADSGGSPESTATRNSGADGQSVPENGTLNFGGLNHELRKVAQKRLPEYMVPAHFIELDEMPLNPNGKIDRNRLPLPASHKSELQIVKPATPLEELLAQIWEEVLAIEGVGLNSNFVDLGGHSLVAMRILARVRDLLQVDVSVQTLLDSRTLEHFASSVIAHETAPGQTRKIANAFKRVQQMNV